MDQAEPKATEARETNEAAAVFLAFLRQGLTAFGGPVSGSNTGASCRCFSSSSSAGG